MFELDSGISAIYPNELVADMTIEGVMVSSINSSIGIAALSEIKSSTHILRLYHLQKTEDNYHFIQELTPFSFHCYNQLSEFLINLPDMSGLEMLMLLNSYNPKLN